MNAEPVTVSVGTALREQFAGACASVPRTFRLSDTVDGDIRVIDGADAEWPRRLAAAADHGAAGILLVAPEPVTDAEFQTAILAASGVPVVIDQPWSGNPVFAGARAWSDELAAADIVNVIGVIGRSDARSLAAAASDALTMAARLTGALPSISSVQMTDGALSLVGRVADATLRVGLVRSDFAPSGVRVTMHAPALEHIIELPAGDTAAPARAIRIDLAGESRLPTIYQDSHRTALLALAEALRTRVEPGHLRELRGVCRSLEEPSTRVPVRSGATPDPTSPGQE